MNREKIGFSQIFSKSVKRKELKIDTLEKVIEKNDFYYKDRFASESDIKHFSEIQQSY